MATYVSARLAAHNKRPHHAKITRHLSKTQRALVQSLEAAGATQPLRAAHFLDFDEQSKRDPSLDRKRRTIQSSDVRALGGHDIAFVCTGQDREHLDVMSRQNRR